MCYSTSATPVCNAAKTGCTTGTLYSAAVSVSNATNLRAIACKSGNNDSSVKTVTYSMSQTYGTLSASVTPTSATLGATCIDSVNTTMDAALPAAIRDNFKCQTAYVNGANNVFKSVNMPNHVSFYYCSLISAGACAVDKRNATLWAALPSGNTSAGTNTIFVQNLEFTIPATPTLKTGTLTGTQNGYVAVGVTVNGLAIFNNAAAPPDTLAAEAATFDGFDGHPQNAGVYHHHAGVRKVGASGTDNNDANLIGIALDGYLIYGKKCDNATATTADDITLTASTGTSDGSAAGITGASATTLDQLHGHTTTTRHLGTATYHYHMALDPTATIDTLLGSYFRGVAGTITN
ncbi:YHYH protein [Turneriella parva]|uniref:YHYH protein n=1 Tax=Turneriella parva TaxID=29510 RepID=UPI003CCAEEF7